MKDIKSQRQTEMGKQIKKQIERKRQKQMLRFCVKVRFGDFEICGLM